MMMITIIIMSMKMIITETVACSIYYQTILSITKLLLQIVIYKSINAEVLVHL
jgi:hypothetical protein